MPQPCHNAPSGPGRSDVPQPDPEQRRHVFISYSRTDRDWVDRLRITMAPLLREAGEELVLWDDSQIRAGERWQKTIETALARARVALLLVSAEFLASDFVMGKEVPVLLEAAEREGVTILWVSLSPCWVSRTPIHAYQAVLPPEPSLVEMSEPQQRRALVRIAEEVHRALEEATARERRRAEEEERARRQREEEERLRGERQERLAAEELARQRAEKERERELQRIQAERERREAERRRAADDARAERQREDRETLARRQREEHERETRAAAERQRAQQRKAEVAAAARLADARARQQLQAVMERLLTRRKLLLAAGLPLGAIGLARLFSLHKGSSGGPITTTSPGATGGALRDQPVVARVSGGQSVSQTIEATHGWLERQGQGWRIQTRPVQVGSRLERLAPDVTLRLIQIPSGRFVMGSPPEELERSEDEGPQHQVTLQGFWLGQTPVTQAQWRVVAGWPKVEQELEKDPSRFKGDDRPVENVNWHDATEFCRRLSQRLGRAFALPSEAQWEYACRAGTTTPFSFGETISPEVANYDGNHTYANGPKGVNRGETTPAGGFPANAWGLQDMHGNVWEWCLDHWHDSYVGAPADGSAWLANAGADALRLLRGGSWFYGPRICRSAFRSRSAPGGRGLNVGFRLCCLPQDSASLHLNP